MNPRKTDMIRKETVAVSVLLLLTLFITGPARGEQPDYFPSREGHSTTYKVEMSKQGTTIPLTMTVMAWRDLDEKRVLPVDLEATIGEHIQRPTVYTQFLDEGIKLVATKDRSDAAPTPKQKDNWEFKYPLAVGTSWVSHEDAVFVGFSGTYPLTNTIESMDDEVTVPAGTFKHCMKIRTWFQGEIDLGSYNGKAEMTVEGARWYAPGVGLVKRLNVEKSDDPKLQGGGQSTHELVSVR
jgi:hypothetical protein